MRPSNFPSRFEVRTFPVTVESMEATERYFGSRASTYQRASETWPWKWLRNRESDLVLKFLPSVRDRDVLDLGAGSGYYSRLALRQGARSVYAVDKSRAMLASIDDPRIHQVEAEAERVSLPIRFPCLISAGLLEFVREPATVLRNARMMVIPSGVFVLLVPRACRLFGIYELYHRMNGISVRSFTLKDVQFLANGSGWKVTHEEHVWPFTAVYRLVSR